MQPKKQKFVSRIVNKKTLLLATGKPQFKKLTVKQFLILTTGTR